MITTAARHRALHFWATALRKAALRFIANLKKKYSGDLNHKATIIKAIGTNRLTAELNRNSRKKEEI